MSPMLLLNSLACTSLLQTSVGVSNTARSMGSLWTTFSPRGRGHPLPEVPRGPPYTKRGERTTLQIYPSYDSTPIFVTEKWYAFNNFRSFSAWGHAQKAAKPETAAPTSFNALISPALFFSYINYLPPPFFLLISTFVNIKGENGKKKK